MRYVMKQKLFSPGDDYFIKDDSGRDGKSGTAYHSPTTRPAGEWRSTNLRSLSSRIVMWTQQTTNAIADEYREN